MSLLYAFLYGIVCIYSVLEIFSVYVRNLSRESVVYGFLSFAVAQSLQHVCARLCVLVRHVLQHASDHWQLARDPAQPGADVVQEAAADHSTDLVVVLQSVEHVLLSEEAKEGRGGAALVHNDAGVHHHHDQLHIAAKPSGVLVVFYSYLQL